MNRRRCISHLGVQSDLSLQGYSGLKGSESVRRESENSLQIGGCDRKRMHLPPTDVLFNMVQKADDYRLKKWMKGEIDLLISDNW